MKNITYLKRLTSAAIAMILLLTLSLPAFAEETETTDIDSSAFESTTENVEDYIQSEEATDPTDSSDGEIENTESPDLPPVSVPNGSSTTDTESEYQSEWSKLFGFDITTGDYAKLDTSSFTAACERLDATAFGQLLYEVPSSVDSISALNLRYAELTKSMADFGYGTQYELKIEQFNPGYASDLLSSFENTYGNASNDSTLEQDMSTIMSGTSAGRDTVSDIKETEEYKNANNALGNSGSISTTTDLLDKIIEGFENNRRNNEKEAAGLEGLEVPNEIWDIYYDAKTSQDKDAATSKQNSSNELNELYNQYIGELPGHKGNNKEDQFNTAKEDIKDWIEDEDPAPKKVYYKKPDGAVCDKCGDRISEINVFFFGTYECNQTIFENGTVRSCDGTYVKTYTIEYGYNYAGYEEVEK